MKYLLFALLMMVTALALTSCKQGANGQQNQDMGKTLTIDNDEFEKIIANKDSVVLVDVRTQEEYDEGHLEGALLMDVKKDSFRSECLSKLDRSKRIAVYCRSGFRSKTAAHILNEAGFDVVNLKAGYNGWTEAGKKTVK
jgi:rhodanese-related sulfurtransferase